MAEPSYKDRTLSETLDAISTMLFGRNRAVCIQADKCVACGEDAKEFKDGLSYREYTISGLCQSCQDKTFGEEDNF